jgi:VCBS repeat-containing protein
MDRSSIRHKFGVGIVFAGLMAGALTARPAAAAGPPVAADDSYTMQGDIQNTVATVLANDTGSGNGTLTAVVVQDVSNGTLSLLPNGTVIYTPNPGYTGLDLFTYQASDGGGTSNVANVYITVDLAPVGNPDSYSTPQDTPLFVSGGSGVLANDTDAEGDPIFTSGLATAPNHGQATLSSGGGFTYTPDPNFQGTDTFAYHPTDNIFMGNYTTVTITVGSGNNAPVGVDDNYVTTVDTPLTINAPGVLSNDTDAENDPLGVSSPSGPTHGTGAIQADGTLTYTPDSGYVGDDVMYYTPYDGTNFGNQAMVTITVEPQNAPAVGSNDSYVTNEDTNLKVDVPGVLANDSDPDNDPIYAAASVGPSHGSGVISTNGSFYYSPNPGFVGDDFMYYRPYDGTINGNQVEVHITVLPKGTPTPEPTDTTTDGVPSPSPTPTDTPADGTTTPPAGSSGDETSTPVSTDTPGVPATSSDDPTPAPPVATQAVGSEVADVNQLPVTGSGPADGSGTSPISSILAILGLGGLSFSLWRFKNRRAR